MVNEQILFLFLECRTHASLGDEVGHCRTLQSQGRSKSKHRCHGGFYDHICLL